MLLLLRLRRPRESYCSEMAAVAVRMLDALPQLNQLLLRKRRMLLLLLQLLLMRTWRSLGIERGGGERGGAYAAFGWEVGTIQGGIQGQQVGFAGEGVGEPIPVVNQTQESPLRLTTITEQLSVVLLMTQGLADLVDALQRQQP